MKGSKPGRTLFQEYWAAFTHVVERDIYTGVIEKDFWNTLPAETEEQAKTRIRERAIAMEAMESGEILEKFMDPQTGELDLVKMCEFFGIDFEDLEDLQF